MTKLSKLIDIDKLIDVDIDEVVANEIKSLKSKITRLENKIYDLKSHSASIRNVEKLTEENREKVMLAANGLVELLKDLNWIEIDDYGY